VNQAASSVGFTIYGSMIFKIHRDGTFKDFTGELAYDSARPSNTHVINSDLDAGRYFVVALKAGGV
jgi:polyisoprenoid-binding protein YceI